MVETGKVKVITYIIDGGGDWCIAEFEATGGRRFRAQFLPGVDFKKNKKYQLTGDYESDPYSVFGNIMRNPVLVEL